ncbi:hypothetical protein T07_9134 [Trichinella nelsoni]|uniref:Uncharacterized protein n=1 Tax=Trichinella nelsoni TaxID=6336 RepID=A0A0V0SD82_9BILA|nr:hypothetical protein T07_9134 [Trichinella nelsoni]
MFGVSEKRPSSNSKLCIYQSLAILSVMYHSNVNVRSSSDLRALLITAKRDSIQHLENSMKSNHVQRERKETIEHLNILYLPITFGIKSRNSKQQIHRKHCLLKNKINKYCNVSQKCQRQIFFRPTRSSHCRLNRRGFFENNGWRELKETPSRNRNIPCQAIMFSVSEKRLHGQIFDETRSATPPRYCNIKSRNSKEQIHSGSSECTLIFSVMHRRNVSGRFSSDLQALLIAYFIRRVSFVNNGWRELKETPWSNRKIPCQAIMFSVSEKRPSSS